MTMYEVGKKYKGVGDDKHSVIIVSDEGEHKLIIHLGSTIKYEELATKGEEYDPEFEILAMYEDVNLDGRKKNKRGF